VDWGMSLLGNATTGAEMFPAKFTFDVNAAPDCTNDFAVYNTSVGGATGADASQTGTVTSDTGVAGQTVTITNGATVLTLTADATLNTGLNFQIGQGSITTATNLAAAIQANGFVIPVFSFTDGNVKVTVGAGNPGTAGNSITLATTLTGFTWTAANLTGGQGQASIIAFRNLYSTQGGTAGLCGNTGPTVMWSYATGPNPVVTSPVLSLDGTKVAYVENPGAAAAILHILKWKVGEGSSVINAFPVTHTITPGTSWVTDCPLATSCISNITFNGGALARDSNSSPFYDYAEDFLYVGDNNGRLHKFTGVFNGTPAEVTTGGWPLIINAGAVLSSPVLDGVSDNIFMGDNTGLLSYVKETGSSAGTCNPGSHGGVVPCLGVTAVLVGGSGAVVDAPIVDGTVGTVFAFNGIDTTNIGTVLQTNTSLTGTPGGANVVLSVGGTGAGSYIHAGSFDNAYLSSTPDTGHLYVCGKDPAHVDRPAIFQLSFAADGTLSTTLGTPLINLVSADGEACSPITIIQNPNAAGGPKEWLFFSIGNHANTVGPTIPVGPCRTAGLGCVLSIDITTPTLWPIFPASSVSVPAGPLTGPSGGNIDSTSGIIVDNVASDPTGTLQVSSIYFTLTANSTGTGPGLPSCNTTAGVGCAIKLTQAALQ
jgi:hypothetical protein